MSSKDKNTLMLVAVLILGFVCLNLAYPEIGNKALKWVAQETGISLPLFPVIPYQLGLDLQGGARLVYQADLSQITSEEQDSALAGLRDVIERRVNMFGVREPKVYIEKVSQQKRLVVELAGVYDTQKAIEMIGKTPYLEFRLERDQAETEEILKKLGATSTVNTGPLPPEKDPYFKATKLNGKYLKNAKLSFDPTTYEPEVTLEFNDEGRKIFAKLTEENIGKRIGIYIDNIPISTPVVREAIVNGNARITGKFTVEEAKKLASDLQAGALPVPIKLVSQDTVGPTLGKLSLDKSLKAGLVGMGAVVLIMVGVYWFWGLLASLSLLIYGGILLTMFKLIPVTLTLAGIAGAILSVGMAVDANVLIFERMKEERKAGLSQERALENGFARAWPSIRDSNLTTLIIALIMFAFGTSFVKGFALTLSLGILVSMFSAIVITRVFLTSVLRLDLSFKSRSPNQRTTF